MENKYNPALDNDYIPHEEYRMRVYHEYVYKDGTRDDLDDPVEVKVVFAGGITSMPQAVWLEEIIMKMANKIIDAYETRMKGDHDE